MHSSIAGPKLLISFRQASMNRATSVFAFVTSFGGLWMPFSSPCSTTAHQVLPWCLPRRSGACCAKGAYQYRGGPSIGTFSLRNIFVAHSALSIRNISYDSPENVAFIINSMPRSCFQQVLGILGISECTEKSQPSVPIVHEADPGVSREEESGGS